MNSFRSAVLSGMGLKSANPLLSEKDSRGAQSDDLSSVLVPRDTVRTSDHRDEDRHRLAGETAIVVHDGKEHLVDLINLSGGGAMIQADDFQPHLWERVDLRLGEGTALQCAVCWIRDDRFGLEFAHETCIEGDADTRDALLLSVIHRTFPDLAPPPARAEMTEEVRAEQSTRRTERRHPLIWLGKVLFNHDSHDVRLRNISVTGALVEGDINLPEGREVMLDLGSVGELFATVSWSRGQQAGLAFAQPFALARLADARPEVAPRRWHRPDFLANSYESDSPWSEVWERSSIEELRNELEGFLKR